MGRSKIDGSGSNSASPRVKISKRAISTKEKTATLLVEKKKACICGHKKYFVYMTAQKFNKKRCCKCRKVSNV